MHGLLILPIWEPEIFTVIFVVRLADLKFSLFAVDFSNLTVSTAVPMLVALNGEDVVQLRIVLVVV